MSNGFLSQKEIDSLLKGDEESNVISNENIDMSEDEISDMDKDLLGEIGNITMGSASTTLSQIINQKVSITTPVVSLISLRELRNSFEVPNIALEVEFISGILGKNLLVMRTPDASVISSLMMGGDGGHPTEDLSEIEVSAVSEAMNQMIGSSATSMATMLGREVNISPPISKIWLDTTDPLVEDMTEDELVVRVSFRMTIGNLVDSTIMQVLPLKTGKTIVKIMMGEEVVLQQNDKYSLDVSSETKDNEEAIVNKEAIVNEEVKNKDNERKGSYDTYNYNQVYEKPIEEVMSIKNEAVEVQKASFQPLEGEAKIGRAHV